MLYTVISTGHGATLKVMTKEDLEEALAEQYWGDRKAVMVQEGHYVDLLEREALYIIPGAPIVPTAKEIVTKYELL
jgi:hypothetical protein